MMLEKVRKPGRAKSFFAYIIFGAIVLVFVFFGVATDNLGGVSGGSGAAVVNSEVISISQFQEIYERLRKQNQSRLNSLSPKQRRDFSSSLRSQALNLLIDREVIVQQAKEAGLVVSDAAVRAAIVDFPWLQEEGRFKREMYDNYLKMTRSSPGEFEERVRKDIIAQNLRELFNQALRPLDAENNRDEKLRATKINLEFVSFTKKQLAQQTKVAEDEVNELLASESGRARLKKYFQNNIAEYTTEEQIRARHILIKVDPKGGAEAEDKALAKIQKIAKEVTSENFGEMAAQYSEGPTKAKKGDLGFFSRGRMVKEFEEVAFSLPVKTVSEPVKTNFGYHLILVEEKKPGGQKKLANVQSDVAKKLLREEQAEKVFQEIKAAAESGHRAQVTQKLKTVGLSWQETGEFALSRQQPPKLPAGGDELLLKALRHKNKKIVPDLHLNNGQYYLAAVKSLALPQEEVKPKNDNEKDPLAGMMQFLASRRANEALNGWREEARNQSRIRTNQQILAN